MNVIGEVEGKTAIIVDDMADTCGTLIAGVNILKEKGAKEIYFALHARPVKRTGDRTDSEFLH